LCAAACPITIAVLFHLVATLQLVDALARIRTLGSVARKPDRLCENGKARLKNNILVNE